MVHNKKDGAREGMHRAKEIARFAKDLAFSAAQEAFNAVAAPAHKPGPSSSTAPLQRTHSENHIDGPPDEPPVVARLMVEIRSDGSRTIARGALQDELSGEQVAIEAKGNSPLELAGQLAKSLLTTPLSSGAVRRAMLAARRKG